MKLINIKLLSIYVNSEYILLNPYLLFFLIIIYRFLLFLFLYFFLYIIMFLSSLNPIFQGSSSSGRTRSFSLLPHLTPTSSPGSPRHLGHPATPSNIVTITHHKSPAAARRAKSQYPGRLLEVKEVGGEVVTVTTRLLTYDWAYVFTF